MAVSFHFKDHELRCPHCKINSVKSEFLEILEDIRTAFGKPMKITSGYRCPTHNENVGGAKLSGHLLGLAVDVHMVSSSERSRFLKIVLSEERIKGIGINARFIHIDAKNRPKKVVFLY